MKRIELTANYLQTIGWFGDKIIDWGSAGEAYSLDGSTKRLWTEYFTYKFNGAINSADGRYAFIYEKNGTKGLLLKEGKLVKEVNRPYYCAEVYEYPAAFITIDDKTYLIHCPIAYDRLDFEDVETGELVTDIPGRKPKDVFHSRLEISPNGTYLLSKGWVWHPLDHIQVYNIKDCLNNPDLLDEYNYSSYGFNAETCTASFIDDKTLLVGSSDEVIDEDANPHPKCIGIWDLETKKLSTPVHIKYEFGNLFAISDELAWDMYQYPKIINIITGEIVAKAEDINSGNQQSAIFSHSYKSPQISFDFKTKSIAITGNEKIYVLFP